MKRKKYSIYLIISFCFFISPLHSQTLNEARSLYQEGKYAEALPAFEKAVKASPKNASYNQWYGNSLLEIGNTEESKKYLQFAADRKIVEAYNSLGKMHYLLYEFEKSAAAYTQYKEALIKDKKIAEADLITPLIQRSERAARMLSRCENIQIIDSVIVDKQDFLSHYSLSKESGFLDQNGDQLTYLNPLKDKKYYAEKREDGGYCLYSEIKLQDRWGDKREIILFEDTLPDNNYPFVLQDGMTIYFASSGEHSIGGYDLFITRYNINNDTYLTPNQMGMPFNSIANDYMMAIDEMNNLGYFATDRFMPENKVIIYTFIPNEEVIPINANSDEELVKRAKITSIKDSWRSGVDYQEYIAQARKNIQAEQNKEKKDFVFVVNDNIVYYSLNDFENDAAKQGFLKIQQLEKEILNLEKEIANLRMEYSKANRAKKENLKSSIVSKEARLESLIFQKKEIAKSTRNLEIKYLRNLN